MGDLRGQNLMVLFKLAAVPRAGAACLACRARQREKAASLDPMVLELHVEACPHTYNQLMRPYDPYDPVFNRKSLSVKGQEMLLPGEAERRASMYGAVHVVTRACWSKGIPAHAG